MSVKESINQVVILAGGRGERLKPFTDNIPKPLYPVQGIPFIDRLIEQVRTFGIKDVLLLLGYKSEQIVEEIGDGSKLGVRVNYDITPMEYGTAQRIAHARDKIQDRFLLMYCDNYCPINFKELCEDFERNRALIQLSVYANKDKYTRDNLIIENKRVVAYDNTRTMPELSGVDIGYAVVDKTVLQLIKTSTSLSSIYPHVINLGKMYATVTEHRYYSIGGFERMSLTEEFFRNKSVVFLDRDGTLNQKPPKACYVERPEEFVWLPGAKEAIKKLKNNNVITILISNQPGIARGNLTEETLYAIHDKMQKDLRKEGCEIDYIYYCPHNWNEGCDCRKPKPGMLYQAQKDLSLDLTKCVLMGDDERDIEAGKTAGCKVVLITRKYTLLSAVNDYLKGQYTK